MTNGRPEAPTDETGALDFSEPLVQPYPMTTVTIAAVSPEGFPIAIALNDPAPGAMTNWIKLLSSKGFTPAANPTPAPTAAQPAETPVCIYHGPMKPSTVKGKEGTFYCPKKLADGTYCKEKHPN